MAFFVERDLIVAGGVQPLETDGSRIPLIHTTVTGLLYGTFTKVIVKHPVWCCISATCPPGSPDRNFPPFHGVRFH